MPNRYLKCKLCGEIINSFVSMQHSFEHEEDYFEEPTEEQIKEYESN